MLEKMTVVKLNFDALWSYLDSVEYTYITTLDMTLGLKEINLWKLLLDESIDIGKFIKINCLKTLVCFQHAVTIQDALIENL